MRKNKSCSFDLTDPYQASLLKFAEDKRHGNFSVFIKQLIAERMEAEQRGTMKEVVIKRSAKKEIEVNTEGFL